MRDRGRPILPRLLLVALVVGAAALASACEDEEAASPCGACGPDETCVQFWDGPCNSPQLMCRPNHPSCDPDTCSDDCNRWLCNFGDDPPFISKCDAPSCPDELQGAFSCRGP